MIIINKLFMNYCNPVVPLAIKLNPAIIHILYIIYHYNDLG